MKRIFTLILTLIAPTVLADNERVNVPRRLTSDDPNFFGVSGAKGDLGEKSHFEFYISIKYPFIENWFQDRELNVFGADIYPDRLYGIYNGGYDFYAIEHDNTPGYTDWYDSSPVVSKHQNPGFAVEWDGDNPTRRFRLGIFHYSNGQTLGDDEETRIQTLRENPLVAPSYWLAEVSRSSNYVSLRYQKTENPEGLVGPGWWQYQVEIRPDYFATEDEIFWDDTLTEMPKFEDYDGIRIMGEYFRPSSFLGNVAWLFRGQLRTGIGEPDALGNVSSKLTLGMMYKTFIVSAYYANEYGHDLSTYHIRTRHWGIGLELR